MNNELGVIYMIYNKENGKFYIGSTQDFRKREQTHFNQLARGEHYNRHLQSSYNKYGRGSFRMKVVRDCISVDNLTDVEQIYLDNLDPDYNIANDAASPMRGREFNEETIRKLEERWEKQPHPFLGRSHTEETKEKISKARSGFSSHNARFTGEEIQGIWEEIVKGEKNNQEIAGIYDTSRGQISRIRNKKLWSSVTDKLDGKPSPTPVINGRAKLGPEEAREIFKLTHQGKLEHKEIAEKYGVCKSTVSAIKRKVVWEDYTKDISVEQPNLNGGGGNSAILP